MGIPCADRTARVNGIPVRVRVCTSVSPTDDQADAINFDTLEREKHAGLVSFADGVESDLSYPS